MKNFIKIANRKNSSQKEELAYKEYHGDSHHYIKLIESKYRYFVINYTLFYYKEFKILNDFSQEEVKQNQNFLEDFIKIATKLKKSKVNHLDISKMKVLIPFPYGKIDF